MKFKIIIKNSSVIQEDYLNVKGDNNHVYGNHIIINGNGNTVYGKHVVVETGSKNKIEPPLIDTKKDDNTNKKFQLKDIINTEMVMK